MVPQTYIKLEGGSAQTMLRLMEAMEDHDDVQKVYANFDIDEADMAAA
jgi:transcriptional/translational regulatory protein YebC/TACO1